MEELCLSTGNGTLASAACESGGEPAGRLVRVCIRNDDVHRFIELYDSAYRIGLSFEAGQELLSRLLCLLAVASSVSPVVTVEILNDCKLDQQKCHAPLHA